MSFLNESLQKIISKIKGKKYIKADDIELIMKDINLAFIKSDINYEVVVKFNELIKQKALGEKVLKGLNQQQQIIKIIKDTLIDILGSKEKFLNLNNNNNLNIILLIGLQGSGKTTTAGKLSLFIQNKLNKKVLLIATDIYRFGAIDQLIQIGKKINIPVFFQRNEKISKIIDNGLDYAQKNKFDTVVIDTSGRLTIDEKMIQELQNIKKQTNPSEILIVSDAILGQESANVVNSFHKQILATGVILTKMDADIKGGAALSIRYITKLPIKFLSSSEKYDDDNFEIFYPERIASRILGMGDILTLIENVENKINSEEEKKIIEKILKTEYNYNDFKKQLKILKKIGSFKKILNFIPGINNTQIKQMPLLENNILNKFDSIIDSMTPKERILPYLIESNNRRRKRIAIGSGNKIQDVDNLILFIKKQKQISNQMNQIKDFDNKSLEDLIKSSDFLEKFLNKK
ncbi:SRP54-type, GTPase domain protein [Candidatus Phytoplasma oryzae]|uniref:signal-recognition-particle GTPase n=1 Tax=Candidatus Phytoplasma oryzae TaxID=203274 RepID=A0A139JQF8_9MOLU|nr:signal recognition particle receptor subunit alpha [Candidatus Phytoplasma oryzae]KXT29195.1 SRP54-type, GTPase domain protein [Candidatus Phytoplasma oryzae]KXT29211.1 SRP54-type, GTPase domain protein [Candidatus Phytoplasma oryzae]RAM57730.1 signal recognition particle [Candidatus Phytoplasma oryzae]